MNAARFRQSVRSFSEGFGRVQAGEDRLLKSVKRFEGRLQELTSTESAAGVSPLHEVAKLADQLKSAVRDAVQRWTEGLVEAAPVKRLSERYQDRAILLVFGKVNSGKSTFVNLLVDELQDAGAGMRGFALQAGRVVAVAPRFAVGATETTARIQGVEVEDRLVFVDSPGLHSVTEENHQHTKLFTESADAVLWLSPSSSPGQVQELHDLKEEMERKKPLLPVITKSDIRVEDWCEATGGITAEIRNKARDVRKEQENDVLARTLQQWSTEVTRPEISPVISVSVLAYENSHRSDDARNEAGLGRLYECLVGLVDSANNYKVGKAEQVARNYIESQVFGAIVECVEPVLSDLTERSDRHISRLDSTKRKQFKDEVETDALSKLRRIVDRHRDSKDTKSIANELSAAITAKLAETFHRELTSYEEEVAGAMVPLLALSSDEFDDFEDITMEFERKKGAAVRSVFASLGGTGGAVLGNLLLPGAGRILGSVGGELLGDEFGKLFEHTEVIIENVAVSDEPLVMSAHHLMRRRIATYVDTYIDAAIKAIRSTATFAGAVKSEIERFKKEVEELT